MTIDEVHEYLKSAKRQNDMVGILPGSDIGNTIIKALEELQQYRAIGTPEELKAAMKYVYLAKKHGTVGQVIENCVKYEEIGTPEECQEAMKKQNVIKPIAVLGTFGGTEYECKNCGSNVLYGHEYCGWCGQKLDWSDR